MFLRVKLTRTIKDKYLAVRARDFSRSHRFLRVWHRVTFIVSFQVFLKRLHSKWEVESSLLLNLLTIRFKSNNLPKMVLPMIRALDQTMNNSR